MSARVAPAPARRIEARQLFQWLSYLQYPALLVALGHAALPLFRGLDGLLDALARSYAARQAPQGSCDNAH